MFSLPQKKLFKNSKLAHSLRVFSSDELKTLGRWLQSPWCTSNKKLYELFLFLKKYIPDFDSPKLAWENIFKQLYPEKPYNDRWLRNIMAELNKQIESFLIHQHVNQEEDLRNIILAKEYEKRHQTKRLLKLAKEFNEELVNKENKSLEDYYRVNFLNDLLYYNPEVAAHWKGEVPFLNQANEYLDQFYFLSKWRYKSEFKERQRLLKEEVQPQIDLDVLEKIGEGVSIPAVALYQQKITEGDDLSEDQFYNLKDKYFEVFNLLAFKDQQVFFFYLLNICVRMCLGERVHMFDTLFELYLVGIDRKLLLNNGRISDTSFSNIVTLGNSLDKFEEVKSFLDQYIDCLRPEGQKDGAIWGMAHWHFNKKEFEKSIDLLKMHKFKTYTFELQGRLLLLRTYFEAMRTDSTFVFLFFDFCSAFKKFIRRHKRLSEIRKQSYFTLIKNLSNLAELVIAKEKEEAKYSAILKTVNEEEMMQAKKWMKETISGIIGALKTGDRSV